MRIRTSRYELRRRDGATRRGALLRVEFGERLVGYADCHPWHERGDLPLDEQLERLARALPTPITRNALAFAREDASARAAARPLGAGLVVPESHHLVWDRPGLADMAREIETAAHEGFRTFKIKSGPAGEIDARRLRSLARELPGVRFRLDFESSLDGGRLHRFVDAIGEAAGSVDFIEDPVPWDPRRGFPETWVRLALDRGVESEGRPDRPADVLVLKPAVNDTTAVVARAASWDRPIVVTSYLDHPLGQVAAAWTAARIARENPRSVETCGLLSHRVYEPDAFSERLPARGPAFPLFDEPGYGFGDLLGGLTWEPLATLESRS